jgi:hypothetical protein
MGFPIGKVLSVAGRVGLSVLTGVPAVQAFAAQVHGASGPAKADAILQLALAELQAAGVAVGHDVSPTPRVTAAIHALIDATVELHAAIAEAAHAPKG